MGRRVVCVVVVAREAVGCRLGFLGRRELHLGSKQTKGCFPRPGISEDARLPLDLAGRGQAKRSSLGLRMSLKAR
jgi:hypothetical protein